MASTTGATVPATMTSPPAGSDNAAAQASLKRAEDIRLASQLPSAGGETRTLVVGAGGQPEAVVQKLPPIDHDFTQSELIEQMRAVAIKHGLNMPTVTPAMVEAEKLKKAQAFEDYTDRWYLQRYNPATPEGIRNLRSFRPQALMRMQRALDKGAEIVRSGQQMAYFSPENAEQAYMDFLWKGTNTFDEYKPLVDSYVLGTRGRASGKPYMLPLANVWADIFTFSDTRPGVSGHPGMAMGSLGLVNHEQLSSFQAGNNSGRADFIGNRYGPGLPGGGPAPAALGPNLGLAQE